MNETRHKVVVCFGTRPEAIKLCPVVKDLKGRSDFDVQVCVTAQHREMLDQVLDVFGVAPDMDLDLMKHNQTLEGITALVVERMAGVIDGEKPDVLIVQGDTTTTFASALAAFYKKVPVAHVEAGLRTHDPAAPFPEEMNRQLTTRLARWHFAPTGKARDALLAEGISPEEVFTVGNTVVDALLSARERVSAMSDEIAAGFPWLADGVEMLLVTGHRRESFGEGFERVFGAIRQVAEARSKLQIVYPVHLNPRVRGPAERLLDGLPNVRLVEPQDYLAFVWLMERSRLILTDSGGIQEEAPTLGKPVLVTREATERMEAVDSGVALLVGTDEELIVGSILGLLEDPERYERMSGCGNPFGDGTSARRIGDILAAELSSSPISGARGSRGTPGS